MFNEVNVMTKKLDEIEILLKLKRLYEKMKLSEDDYYISDILKRIDQRLEVLVE
jgi:hypothetical protein